MSTEYYYDDDPRRRRPVERRVYAEKKSSGFKITLKKALWAAALGIPLTMMAYGGAKKYYDIQAQRAQTAAVGGASATGAAIRAQAGADAPDSATPPDGGAQSTGTSIAEQLTTANPTPTPATGSEMIPQSTTPTVLVTSDPQGAPTGVGQGASVLENLATSAAGVIGGPLEVAARVGAEIMGVLGDHTLEEQLADNADSVPANADTAIRAATRMVNYVQSLPQRVFDSIAIAGERARQETRQSRKRALEPSVNAQPPPPLRARRTEDVVQASRVGGEAPIGQPLREIAAPRPARQERPVVRVKREREPSVLGMPPRAKREVRIETYIDDNGLENFSLSRRS